MLSIGTIYMKSGKQTLITSYIIAIEFMVDYKTSNNEI